MLGQASSRGPRNHNSDETPKDQATNESDVPIMSKGEEGKSKKGESGRDGAGSKAPRLDRPIGLYFRDRIRSARAAAQADAEGHMEAARVIEEIGRFFTPPNQHGGMGNYKDTLLRSIVPSEFHSEFNSLWELVQHSRNDMVHGGASARHLTSNVIALITLLEEAIMDHVLPIADERLARYLMVQNPIRAELWMPLGAVRMAMLSSSFSTIPVYFNDGWHLITDEALTKIKSRADRALTVSQSIASKILALSDATTVAPDCRISDLFTSADSRGFPVLVVDGGRNEKDALLGIISAYDLL